MVTQTEKGTALITGASSGIGAVYADRLARRGYNLILVARGSERLARLAERLARESGRKIEVLKADLTVQAELRQVEARLRSDAGITLLLNSAGVGATAPLLDSDPDSLETMIELNVVALTRLTAAVVPGFVERSRGIVINIGSALSLAPEMFNGAYSGTKAYVLNLTQSLHQEVGAKGVQVQIVLPGATRTEYWDHAGLPVSNLPEQMVMSADDLVDAALAGLDQRELVTIPSLPEVRDWETFNAARLAMGSKLSQKIPAQRYKSAVPAAA